MRSLSRRTRRGQVVHDYQGSLERREIRLLTESARRLLGGGQRFFAPAGEPQNFRQVEQRVGLCVEEVRLLDDLHRLASQRLGAFELSGSSSDLRQRTPPKHLRQDVVLPRRILARATERLSVVVLAERIQGMREEGPEGYRKFIQDYFKKLTEVKK